MTKKNITKRSLMLSGLSLLICISMLIGSTFAWFTDGVSSMRNIITAGNLDVELLANGQPVDQTTKLFDEVELWEPGMVVYENLQVVNRGTLALKYEMQMIFGGENDFNGHKLSEVLQIAVIDKVEAGVDRESVVAAAKASDTRGSLNDFFMSGMLEANTADTEKGVVIFWEPGANDNLYNVNNGQSTSNGEPLSIEFGVNLRATQAVSESDSFGNDYDKDATLPTMNMDVTVSKTLKTSDVENGVLTRNLTLANADGSVSAEIPAGVKIALGARALTMTITSIKDSEAGITANNRSEVVHSVDVHIDGIAEDNTVPMIIAIDQLFPAGLNDNNLGLYHVEIGQTIEMTLVDDPKNHNEFSYDPMNGNAVIAIASFSEIAAYADTNANWDGKTVDYTWYKADAVELEIANAEQFVAFRNIVDGVKIDGVYTIDDFKGQKITLSADINLNGHNFDPIGWGYDNAEWNSGGASGKVFKGHFDGGNNAIFGLYQNGWDLESATGTDYTYANCGGGLFASALDATFENLTIDGADIKYECVEIGVLLGLAQGNCTFTNINITGSKIANYQRPAGGVVGEVSPKVENGTASESTHTFNNVYVDSNTVVGSLWGDFDAPVGGVIGAYWDDAGKTKVEMNNVTVACELDVYNDVTSTYQWYAYRRAGMLIGNSDRADGHTATAPFLTCNGVTVYYDDWADYHYCEFNKANPNWPWVRVEPGENCSGYSNPRWGRPNDSTTGQPVTDPVHEHGEGEGHLQLIPFHQLYGGGQGVYGATEHKGVSEGVYTVTYMDHGKVLHVDNVTDNSVAYTKIWDVKNAEAANGDLPSYWVKADNTKFEGVNAGNTANVIVYPKWPNEYTIRCLDTYGEVAYYNFVIDDKTTDAEYEKIATEINNTLVNIQNEVDEGKKVMVIVWDDGKETLTSVTASKLKSLKGDYILTATPQLQTTSITLEKVYDERTGELVAYRVAKVTKGDDNTSVVIPDYVGKIPVTTIDPSAAAGFDNLHTITIPGTVKKIGKTALSDANKNGSGETITIYFEGTKEDWDKIDKVSGWDDGLGSSCRIFFLKNGKVDPSQGYMQRTGRGYLVYNSYDWEHKNSSNITAAFIKDYAEGICDCKVTGCSGKLRPDAHYWEGVTIN